ncbi:response regulator transcription factor [Variovorax saccharolyticus]|uniref:response regulator transcription factor n=1 Tax=Variovorax saccharolyticus TaxID=3053516 RepID=UPI0025763DAA|nr:response regulator transcription factor [Variovorax sp. J31P216]MDM0028379.1 response regulator transcription factor [Variovorax sp. J31P216]
MHFRSPSPFLVPRAVGSGSRVLIVDDDLELGSMLIEYLEQEGFAAHQVVEGEAGVREALSGGYDIVVLDVMLPRMNGVEVLRGIRSGSRIPVLMLTARGDGVDRILGLELGADDYVPKPSSPRELVARLRAILRRFHPAAGHEGEDVLLVAAGPVSMWPGRRLVECEGRPVNLTGAEFNLLEVLLRHAGRLVSKSELSEQGLGRPMARFDRSIDVHISSIRLKLARSASNAELIRTVRGMGYQFVKH